MIVRFLVLAVFLIAVPIGLKQTYGTSDVARKVYLYGIDQDAITKPLEEVGFHLAVNDAGSYATSDHESCHLEVIYIDPAGQRLGIVYEQAKRFDRLSFLFRQHISDDFPYFPAIFRHVFYSVTKAVGLEGRYEPVAGLFQKGECTALDPLRLISTGS